LTDVLLFLGILAVIFILWVAIYDTTRFVKVTYHIKNPKLTAPFRAVLLTDLHNQRFGKGNGRLLQAILEQRPDVVIIVGDMITKNKNLRSDNAIDLIKGLTQHVCVYYTKGNHEQNLDDHEHHVDSHEQNMDSHEQNFDSHEDGIQHKLDKYWQTLRELGVHFLENKSVTIQSGAMTLHGLELDRHFYKRGPCPKMEEAYLTKQLGEIPSEGYHILLAHHPAYLEAYAAWGADLVLSGHMHGGIVRIPAWRGVLSPAITLFPKYDGGLFTKGKTSMILSRGIGYHGLPFRLFNPNELVMIQFQGADEGADESSVCLEKNLQL
jgi:predicted MPP superfamily phosphohydrolase